MSIIFLYDTLQPTPPQVDTVINKPLWQSAPLQRNRLLQLLHVFELSAFWRLPTNNIKLLCFATCVSKLLLHSFAKNHRITSGHWPAKTSVGTTLVGPPCIIRFTSIRPVHLQYTSPVLLHASITVYHSIIWQQYVKKHAYNRLNVKTKNVPRVPSCISTISETDRRLQMSWLTHACSVKANLTVNFLNKS